MKKILGKKELYFGRFWNSQVRDFLGIFKNCKRFIGDKMWLRNWIIVRANQTMIQGTTRASCLDTTYICSTCMLH